MLADLTAASLVDLWGLNWAASMAHHWEPTTVECWAHRLVAKKVPKRASQWAERWVRKRVDSTVEMWDLRWAAPTAG